MTHVEASMNVKILNSCSYRFLREKHYEIISCCFVRAIGDFRPEWNVEQNYWINIHSAAVKT